MMMALVSSAWRLAVLIIMTTLAIPVALCYAVAALAE